MCGRCVCCACGVGVLCVCVLDGVGEALTSSLMFYTLPHCICWPLHFSITVWFLLKMKEAAAEGAEGEAEEEEPEEEGEGDEEEES